LTLKQAREKAQELLIGSFGYSRVPTGPLPAEEVGERPINNAPSAPPEQNPASAAQKNPAVQPSAPADASPGLTVLQICDSYVQSLEKQKKRSWKQIRSLVRRHIADSELASRLAREVDSAQITRVLRRIVADHSGLTATKVRSLLHAAYAQVIGAELSPTATEESIDTSIRTNPVSAVDAMSKFKKSRKRFLSQAELRELWRRVSADSQTADEQLPSRATRLTILLGGQRCEQLLRATHADVDSDAATILLMDEKGQREQPRPHLLPLTSSAKEQVQWLLEHGRSCGSSYLVPGRTKGTSLSPSTVSKFVTAMCVDMLAKRQASCRFQFSDIRRTVETTMAALGVHKDVRAHVQSHGLSGVQEKHYDMYHYMPEKKAALELWEKHLKSLLEPDSGDAEH